LSSIPPPYDTPTPPKYSVKTGDTAPNFRLTSVKGGSGKVTLESLFSTKPVLLVCGSITCPMTSKSAPVVRKMKDKYGTAFHYILVYIVEVHPKGGLHPYSGEKIPADEPTSIEEQAMTFEQRVKAAERLESVYDGVFKDLFDYILVDDLGPDALMKYNPVWSTYGTCPNPCWVVGKDGIVKFNQFFTAHDGAPPDLDMDKGEATLDRELSAVLS